MIRRLIRSATLLIHVLRGQCEGKIHCRAAAGSLRGSCCNIATLEPHLARYRRSALPDFNQAICVSVPFVRMALFSIPVVRAWRPCRACNPGRYDLCCFGRATLSIQFQPARHQVRGHQVRGHQVRGHQVRGHQAHDGMPGPRHALLGRVLEHRDRRPVLGLAGAGRLSPMRRSRRVPANRTNPRPQETGPSAGSARATWENPNGPRRRPNGSPYERVVI